eukprot:scaffold1678_cov80-Cylindrotheca_fusiformis.AAC.4
MEDDEEETDWAQFEDAPEHPALSSSTVDNSNDIVMIPPQLHPAAVSFGMRKVSSSYFSIASHESMMTADLISKLDETNNNNSPAYDTMEEEQWDTRSLQFDKEDSSDLLYHDILMNVFTFLDAQALAAFSETARRPNFEVFYFLQLQLQRAIVLVENDPQNKNTESTNSSSSQQHHDDDDDELTAIAGSAFLSRLTRLDPQKAQETVNEYLESNSTLRSMPLSHSIAYMRHFLNRRRGFYNQLTNNNTESSNNNNNNSSNTPSPQALASAALLATVVGAAYMSSSSGGGGGGGGEMMMTMPIPPELPNILFRFGFVGSLMGAAKRQMSDVENYNNKSHQFRFPSSLLEMKETLTATLRNNMNTTTMMNATTTTTTTTNQQQQQQQKVTERMLSNPYDHHHHHIDEAKDNDGREEEKEEEKKEEEEEEVPQKMPSGCVGAYSRAIASATNSIENLVKEGRKNRFAALDEDEQQLVVMTFLDACSSDDGLALLQQMIHTMDVDGFHLASDGSETCALHTAAFNGAAKVLDYLLQGIDDSDESKDGGLCQVNCRDSNGWTALHFAAGSNSVSAIHVLAKHGADLSMEANNGYSPLQWAKRLSNEQAEEALKELIHNESDRTLGWMSSQPLTTIANRFFALMPSH